MTSKNGLLNKSFLEEPVARIIERGPWANYARCDECGVDAGKACRDDDDCVALEVCDGRRLVVVDAYAKCKTLKPGAQTQRDKVSTNKNASPPVYAPCQHCGEPVRLWGQGLKVGKGWCSTVACYKARKAEQSRLANARRREERLRNEEIESTKPHCYWCGARICRALTPRPSCTERACVRAKNREDMRAKRELDKSRKVDSVATEVRE